jgi:hypothetical protein
LEKNISMNELNENWKQLCKWFENEFGMESDPNSILFIVGVQELGKGLQNFNKTQKVELMHVAVCSILLLQGYYQLSHRDEDGWPHFENIKKLPVLIGNEQDEFIKNALIAYFRPIIKFQKET